MRLHIVQDEKVIQRTIDNFEAVFPGDNKFIVLSNNGNKPQYVECGNNVLFCKFGTNEFWNIVGSVNQYSMIVIHYMSPEAAKFINKIEHHCIYWIEWGADLFNALLEIKGFKLYEDNSLIYFRNNTYLPNRLWLLRNKVTSYIIANRIVKAAKKVKYFVPDSMYDEYPLLLKYYPSLSHLEYREFFYYPIDEIVGPSLVDKTVAGDNIMVGNSSSLTGNHKYVFDLLLKVKNKGTKVICPLSYGNRTNAKDIQDYGEKLFASDFSPLLTFMPLSEYNKVMLGSSNFIYGNIRQEAVGNILIALYLGGKVYLHPSNPLLVFYRRLGITLFTLEDLTSEQLRKPLDKDSANNNRYIVIKHYSKTRQLALIKENF